MGSSWKYNLLKIKKIEMYIQEIINIFKVKIYKKN